MRVFTLALLGLAAAPGASAETTPRSVDTTGWTTLQQGMPTLFGSAFGASLYAVVGKFGEVWTSPDLTTWTRRTNPDPSLSDLRGLTYGGSQFVAVGGCAGCPSGPVLRSTDGQTWTHQDLPEAAELRAVTYGGGQYVAVGAGGRVITSADAVAWTQRTSNTSATLNGVAFGGGLFVTVGAGHEVVTSPDGATWTVQTAGVPSTAGDLSAVAWGGGTFAAVGSGGIIASANGSAWTPTTVTTNYRGVTHTGSLFVAVPRGPLVPPSAPFPLTSPDGTSWTPSPLTPPPPGLNSFFETVSSGAAGVVGAGYSGMLFSSPDGAAAWTSRTLDASRGFLGIVGLCAVGGGNAVARGGGETWINGEGVNAGFWRSVANGEGYYVAVGTTDAAGLGGLMTSPDCSVWTDRSPPVPSGFDGYSLTEVAYGNEFWGGQFLAVGEKYRSQGTPSRLPFMLSSYDGLTWTEIDSGLPTNANGRLGAVAWCFEDWLAAGMNYDTGAVYVVTATGGPQPATGLPPSFVPEGVACPSGPPSIVVGSGTGAGIWSSPDKIAWTQRQTGAFFDVVPPTLDNQFVAVGARGAVQASLDGITWYPQASSTTFDLAAVSYLPGSVRRYFAVGPSVITFADSGLPDVTGDYFVFLTEGTGGSTTASFPVTLSAPSPLPVTLSYQTWSGSATEGSDYTPMIGTLSFAPYETMATIDVPVNPDSVVETDESFSMYYGSPVGANETGGPGSAIIVDDDAQPVSQNEVGSGSEGTYSLGAIGGVPAVNRFVIGQQPFSSYEVVVDGATGDVVPLVVQRLAGDNATVLQTAQPIAGGSSLSLRWKSLYGIPVLNQSVAISSGGCTTDCDADDVYSFRSYDTTLAVARYSNSGTQKTYLVLQNLSSQSVLVYMAFWDAAGNTVSPPDLLSYPIVARAARVFDTSTLAPDTAGSITIAHTARYGELMGKAVTIEEATGFAFDTPALPRAK